MEKKCNDSNQKLSDSEQLKIIWQGWYPIPLSGFLIALLVSVFSLAGAEGAKEAMEQLVHHTLEIHPLFWAFCFTAVTLYIAMLGWRLKSGLKFFLVPIVSFVTHLLGLAVGAIVVIAGYKYFAPSGLGCHDYFVGISLLALSTLFSLMGVAGAMFIKHEKNVDEPKDAILIFFLVMSLLGFGAIYKSANSKISDAKENMFYFADKVCKHK